MNPADTILFAALTAWCVFGLALVVARGRDPWHPATLVFAILLSAAAVPRLIQLLLS